MNIKTFLALTFLLVGCLFNICDCEAQVQVSDLGAGNSFVDLGLDPASNDLVLVGTQDNGGSGIASVYRLSDDRSSFSVEALVGLGPNTTVSNIAADGSWIAGTSDTPASGGLGEGTAWNSSSPTSPFGVGPVNDFAEFFQPFIESQGLAAFSGGIYGTFGSGLGLEGFGSGVFRWTPSNGTEAVTDPIDAYRINDASLDGSIVGGIRSNGLDPRPSLLDTRITSPLFPGSDIEVATDVFPLEGGLFSTRGEVFGISPNGQIAAGDLFTIANVNPPEGVSIWTQTDTGFQRQAVTREVNGTLTEIFGTVVDVSDSGFVLFETSQDEFFIWNEDFNGVDSQFVGAQLFDDWIAEIGNLDALSPTTGLIGIAENENSIQFAVESGENTLIYRVGSAVRKGDVNMDGVINFFDIAPFILALQSSVFQAEADCNCDTNVDFLDIAPFIAILAER